MMGIPVDLQAVTRDVKARVRRVIGELESIRTAAGSDICIAPSRVLGIGALDP